MRRQLAVEEANAIGTAYLRLDVLPPETQPARMLVLPALNAMIDITTTRTVAAQTHSPSVVYAMLVVLMLMSSLLAGHRMAEGKTTTSCWSTCGRA